MTTAASAAREAAVMTASGAGSEAMSACTISTPSVAARLVPHCGKTCTYESIRSAMRKAVAQQTARRLDTCQTDSSWLEADLAIQQLLSMVKQGKLVNCCIIS